MLHLWLDYALGWSMGMSPAQGENKQVATLLRNAIHYNEQEAYVNSRKLPTSYWNCKASARKETS